jgi:hypothetical protein
MLSRIALCRGIPAVEIQFDARPDKDAVLKVKYLNRTMFPMSATARRCLDVVASAFSTPAPACPAASSRSPDRGTVLAGPQASGYLGDILAFTGYMRNEGYWMGGSANGYGCALNGFGYGYGYGDPIGGFPIDAASVFRNAWAAYEAEVLMTAVDLLTRDREESSARGRGRKAPSRAPGA